MSILDNVPLATLITLAGIVVIVVGMINHDLTVDDALKALGALAGGAGILGVARAASGKGIAKRAVEPEQGTTLAPPPK